MKPILLSIFCGLILMQSNVFPQDRTNQDVSVDVPNAKRISKVLEIHGDKRSDDYYWMRDRENPEVIDYLNAENAYLEKMLAPTESLQQTLYNEMVGRIKETDTSAPYQHKGFQYYSRTEQGKQYRIYCRKAIETEEPKEQIMLDVNKLAEGHSFCSLRSISISPNQNMVAYAIDTVGRRKYTVHFKDLTTGNTLAEKIVDVTGNMAWANDNKHLFYTRQDPGTLRAYQIYRHELGTDPANDTLVFEESDEEFSCFVFASRSRDYIIIGSTQTLSTEYRIIDANHPTNDSVVFLPRSENHEYSIDHINNRFFVRTNWNAKNFRLMETGEAGSDKSNWKEVIEHRDDVFFESYELYDNYLAVEERSNGLTEIKIRKWDDEEFQKLDTGEEVYVASIQSTPDTTTPWFRYSYESMTTPSSVRELNVETGDSKFIWQLAVLGGFDRDKYRAKRIWAIARDGEKVPVSLVHHVDTKLDGTAPCLLYAYGSYGSSMDPGFSSTRLSLLDRGFVYAIAHIRGGQEMGRRWYEDGKLLKKINTFTDFIDSGIHLVNEKICDPKRLYARGGSAGGLLIGAVINMRPDLFHGVIADVPFVDVVTTMLDESIPLTTSEYDEWGNPNDPEYYRYMLSYSPYDNVEAKEYPNMLVTSGLHDSQVQYWEPTKWVAKLRAKKTGDNMLVLKTNMEAGHGGASGRYDRFKEVALRYAFLLHLAELSN